MVQPDPYNLQRFVDAQHGVIDTAIAELRAGSKQGHWMWFVFPQLAGLGRSATARFYAIRSPGEARAYLDHALLGPRLRECVRALGPWVHSRTAKEIFGPIDSMKLRSSLTLFDRIDPGTMFEEALLNLFGGERDEQSLALLQRQR